MPRPTDAPVIPLPAKKYRVTLTESHVLHARNEDEAKAMGTQFIAYFGGDTQDIEVEELED